MPVCLRRPIALGACVLLTAALTGCGASASSTATDPDAGPETAAITFGADIPPAPARDALWRMKLRGVTDAAAARGVVGLLDRSSGKLVAVAAPTGERLWQAPVRSPQFLLSDSAGPGDTDATGVFFTTEDSDVPQDGLTPASVRTDLVARAAADGAERWRAELLRQPLESARQPVGGAAASGDVVTVAAGSVLYAFDAATGQERWRNTLPEPPAPSTEDWRAPRPASWHAVALSDDDVVASARLSSGEGTLVRLDRRTGRGRWRHNFAPGGSAEVHQVMLTPTRVVTLVTSSAQDSYRSSTDLIGLRLKDGRRSWDVAGASFDRDRPMVLDGGDGTVLHHTRQYIGALNALDGTERWRIPRTVTISDMAAGDGHTYLTTASGQSRQIVVVETRTGEQQHVLPTDDEASVRLFAGAVLVIFRDAVALHR